MIQLREEEHCETHRHSEFSPLDGTGNANQYASRAYEIGQAYLGLTDHHTLGGALDHIRACREPEEFDRPKHERIIPIVGCEIFCAVGESRFERDYDHNIKPHLCLHASGIKGWHNLIQLVTQANVDGFHGVPRVDWDLHERFNEGLIVSTACISSPLNRLILDGDEAGARKWIERMLDIYKDRFWFEIMGHDLDPQRICNLEIINFANEYGRPVKATGDAHAPLKEWGPTQEIVFAMSRKEKLSERQEKERSGDEVYGKDLGSQYLMTAQEKLDLFKQAHPDIPEEIVVDAIRETTNFAQTIKPYVVDKDPKFPRVSKSAEDAEQTLRKWAEEGFEREHKRRPDFVEKEERYREQLEFELGVLRDREGALDYFVMSGKEIRRARSRGVRTGVRGSAAGCLLSYLIGIVDIDPLAYGLMFERFLNPDREGMPDIDFDIAMSDPPNDIAGRDEVIDMLVEEYGEERVAHVVSYQTFAPRSAIGDVASYFDSGPNKVEFMDRKNLTEKFGATDRHLEKLMAAKNDDGTLTLPELKAYAEKYPVPFEHSLRIDDMVKAPSKHASAIIVADKPISRYAPLNRSRGKKKDGSDDKMVVAWADRAEFPIISTYGLFKIDYLGLEEFTKHEYTCRMIAERTGEMPKFQDFPIMWDPYDTDPKVMDAFKRGLTLGVFQFGSTGITQLLRAIKPDTVLDLTAAAALYRPGAMKFSFDYAKRKNGEQEITYWHEAVIPYLEETYGLVAYQEQVMNICKAMGNFTPGQADSMRKAISKLYRMGKAEANKFMEKFRAQWDRGCVENGISNEIRDSVWENILEWGGYGFNKSHSAWYSVLAYLDMWLKVYHPHEFYAGLLTYPSKLTTSEIIREAQMMGVDVLPPDVNKSSKSFTIAGEDGLRYGLESIKSIGGAAANHIIAERPFKDFADFAAKRGIGEARHLLKAGAFDATDDRMYLLSKVKKFETPKARATMECGCSKVVLKADVGDILKCAKHDQQRVESTEPHDPEWTVADHIAHNQGLKKPKPLPDERIEPSTKELANMEKDALGGVALSAANALIENAQFIEDRIYTQDEFEEMEDGQKLLVGGEIVSRRQARIKNGRDKGREMCYLEVAYAENRWPCKMWADTYAQYETLLDEANAVMIYGRKDTWNDKSEIVVIQMDDLEDLVNEEAEAEADAC